MVRIFARVAFAACLVAAVSGCVADGDQPEVRGRVVYDSPGGGFGLSYVSPPWRVGREDEVSLELRIDAELFGVTLEGSPPSHAVELSRVDAVGGIDEFIDIDPVEIGGTGTGGETEGGLPPLPLPPQYPEGFPRYLLDIDLGDPRAVAAADLTFLLDEQGAAVDRDLQPFMTAAGEHGVVFQVVVSGLFVRGFYVPTRSTVLRALFVSLFDLHTDDMDRMAGTIRTDRLEAP